MRTLMLYSNSLFFRAKKKSKAVSEKLVKVKADFIVTNSKETSHHIS